MITNAITWIFSNYGLFLFFVAVILSILNHFTNPKLQFVEIFYRWVALLPLGFTAIYAFVMHAFFPDFTAATIGWSNSPFQYEVAMANLGFGVIGILSFRASYGFRLATVIANTCWLWGDAVGHSYQMISHHNFAPGNAGSWFYMDVLIPFLLIICMIKLRPHATGR